MEYRDILDSLKEANVKSGIADLLEEEYESTCKFGTYVIKNKPDINDPIYVNLRNEALVLCNEVNYYFN